MKKRFARLSFVALIVLVAASFCLVDAGPQSSKKRRSRRVTKPPAAKPVITNPTINPPEGELGSDVKIVSTADEMGGPEQPEDSSTAGQPNSDDPGVQNTINSLSNQVEKLNKNLGEMQENDRALLDMERLTRAEQRAESLRSQLLDNVSKLADLTSRLEGIEFASKPENIERANAVYGSTRPEEAREARRRQLEKEKALVQSQIKILETGRVRLETAVTNADAEVDLLRRRVDNRQQERDRAEQAERSTNSRQKPN
jgi:hypothetical protein